MYYIGLDIGGTKCAATLGKFTDNIPQIIDKKYFLTEQKEPDEILKEFSIKVSNTSAQIKQEIGVTVMGKHSILQRR